MSYKIRKKIDEVIGRRKRFTDEDKKAIYTKIEERNGHVKDRRKSKVPVIAAYVSAAVLLVVFVSAGLLQNQPDNTKNQVNAASSSKQVKEKPKKREDKMVPSPKGGKKSQHKNSSRNDDQLMGSGVVESVKNNPDKLQIVKKMYYSLDYIHNVQGEFTWGNHAGDPAAHIKFAVDFDQKKSRAAVEGFFGRKSLRTFNTLFKDGVSTVEFPEAHIFGKHSAGNNSLLPYLLNENRFVTQNKWFSVLTHSQWHYRKDTKFGMPVYKIEGVTSSGGRPFEMTVSKETGAILNLKRYAKNSRQQLTLFIKVKHIKINQGISDNVFHLDVSGDQKTLLNLVGKSSLKAQAKMILQKKDK